MITTHATSENTPMHKIAARRESRSAWFLSGVAAANDVEIKRMRFPRHLSATSCKLNRDAAGPDARTGRQWTRRKEEDHRVGWP